ncbi:phospholipase D family protein [Haloarchaeobius sp. DFWS5]|uniref:phospholipase D family protein n=1 Tax=Haloarchaeobius sp. DFWS5 TaxID=3446114 RepID=UPI003EC108A1
MKVGAIGQGFGIPNQTVAEIIDAESAGFDGPPTTIGEAVVASIQDDSFQEIQFVVAFATKSGVSSVIDAVESSSLERYEYFIGADQEATTKQALEELLDSEIETSWIRFRSSGITFHPKVYLFRGDDKIRLIVGSANVTQPGLSANVEAGMVYECNPANSDELGPISDIEETLIAPVREKSEPLTESSIQDLEARGYIGDESNREFGPAKGSGASGESDEQELDPLGTTTGTTASSLSGSVGGGDSGVDGRSEIEEVKDFPSRGELPTIPQVDDFPTKTDREFYERLLNGTDNQPSIMRRTIYVEGEISQGELKRRLVEDHGYDNSGSLDASLRVLWRTTGEVEKRGQGESANLVWIRD